MQKIAQDGEVWGASSLLDYRQATDFNCSQLLASLGVYRSLAARMPVRPPVRGAILRLLPDNPPAPERGSCGVSGKARYHNGGKTYHESCQSPAHSLKEFANLLNSFQSLVQLLERTSLPWEHRFGCFYHLNQGDSGGLHGCLRPK